MIARYAVIVLISLLIIPLAYAQVEIRTIAVSGESPPDVPGRTFETFSVPALNDSGTLAFYGYMDNSDPTDNEGLWVGTPDSLSLALRSGDLAPDGSGDSVLIINSPGFEKGPVLNNSGDLVLGDAIGGWRAIIAGKPGAFRVVARRGTPVPGRNLFYASFSEPSLSPDGHIAFAASIGDPGNGIPNNIEGFWVDNGTTLSEIAVTGEAAPDTSGQLFTNLVGNYIAVTVFTVGNNGVLPFKGELNAPDSSADSGLWLNLPGGPDLIAKEGDPAPGLPSHYGKFVVDQAGTDVPGVNNAGTVIFSANSSSIGGNTISGPSIFIYEGGVVSPLVRKGEAAPGFDGTFAGLNPIAKKRLINNSGQVAFSSQVWTDDDNLDVLWMGMPDSLGAVAAEGQPAPGIEGVFIRSISQLYAINDNGMIAFAVWLDTGDNTNDLATYGGLPDCPQLIVREGDPLEVRPGDVRTVSTAAVFGISAGSDGRRSSLNNANELAFRLAFTDGSQGIFMAKLQGAGPVELLETLIEDVQGLDAHQGTVNSLVKKLLNAQKKVSDESQVKAAINTLNAFINEVEAQTGKKLNSDTAAELVDAAEQIIALLENPVSGSVCS